VSRTCGHRGERVIYGQASSDVGNTHARTTSVHDGGTVYVGNASFITLLDVPHTYARTTGGLVYIASDRMLLVASRCAVILNRGYQDQDSYHIRVHIPRSRDTQAELSWTCEI
jgi:hypothetical protein